MKDKEKFPNRPAPKGQLLIQYCPQKCRGLSSFSQKNKGVYFPKPTVIPLNAAEDAGSLGKSLISLFENMENLVPARELKLNHRSITGWISGQPDESQVQFESTLERDFAYLAFYDRRVFGLQAQPFTLKYIDSTGGSRSYTPDFRLQYRKAPNHIATAIVEIKYQQELDEKREEFSERFAAMERWCAENNAEFHVVTETEIRAGERIQNVKALYPFQLSEDDDGEGTAELAYFISQKGPLSIREILDRLSKTKEQRARVQHNIWWLIAAGTFWVKLDEQITFDTVVYLEPDTNTYELFFSPNPFEQG